jgi:hypothetical protein
MLGNRCFWASMKPEINALLPHDSLSVVRSSPGCASRFTFDFSWFSTHFAEIDNQDAKPGILLICKPPQPPAALEQNYAPGHAHASPARQKVLLREIRPRWHPARVHWRASVQFLYHQIPNGNKFIACDPLGHSGAAATTRGRSGALQIENLRHLGSLIKTGAQLIVHFFLSAPCLRSQVLPAVPS